jgi:excisionase family DNA binding protein
MSSEELAVRRFLTVEQVAEELNVGTPQVRALLKSGELRGFQIGGRRLWRIGAEDVESFIREAYEQTARRIAAGEALDNDDLDVDGGSA